MMLRVMLSLCLLLSSINSEVNMPKMQKPKPPRTVIQPIQMPKDICISTDCGKPRPPHVPKVQDPRFIRPKKTPKPRDA